MTGSKAILSMLSLGAVAATAALASAGFAQSSPVSGDVQFKQKCAMCHSVVKGKASPIGPNLFGVAGRKSGTTTFAYSPALKKSGLVWNNANLDKYLTSPSKAVPGTKMVIGVPDAKQRAAIIAYLNKVK